MELSCNIVRDLVGVCTDCAASDDTKNAVQAHLAACPACARYYYDYERIGRRHRASGNRPVQGPEDGYRALSLRLRRQRNIELISAAAAIAAAASLTAVLFSVLTKPAAGDGQGDH